MAAKPKPVKSPDELSVFPQKEEVEAKKSTKFEKEASDLFAKHAGADAFHFTSDGLAFFQVTDARVHASSLEVKDVITKLRVK